MESIWRINLDKNYHYLCKIINDMLIRSFVLTCYFLLCTNLSHAQKEYRAVAIGFYNVENLFDTINDPAIRDDDFTPDGVLNWTAARYQMKLENVSRVLSEIATDINPDGLAIVGLAEVENRTVLEDLVNMEKLAGRHYQIEHYDSPDFRGIDVALIYNPRYFRRLESKPIPVSLKNLDGQPVITREILYVKGILDGDTIHLMVNHWPSRRGGEAATRHLRNGCAQVNRTVADSLRNINPNAKILIMGDFNDDPDNESISKVLSAKRKIDQVSKEDMYNPFYDYYKKGIGTLAYQDAWSLFDQIVLSKGLVNKEIEGYQFMRAGIYNQPYLQQKVGRYKGYPFRTFDGENFINGYSDHFFVYILLKKALKY
jgi:endonuclease/exonuclease/phosphatase family metal-dependent hydrolase